MPHRGRAPAGCNEVAAHFHREALQPSDPISAQARQVGIFSVSRKVFGMSRHSRVLLTRRLQFLHRKRTHGEQEGESVLTNATNQGFFDQAQEDISRPKGVFGLVIADDPLDDVQKKRPFKYT